VSCGLVEQYFNLVEKNFISFEEFFTLRMEVALEGHEGKATCMALFNESYVPEIDEVGHDLRQFRIVDLMFGGVTSQIGKTDGAASAYVAQDEGAVVGERNRRGFLAAQKGNLGRCG
jgi:hypothetical protein